MSVFSHDLRHEISSLFSVMSWLLACFHELLADFKEITKHILHNYWADILIPGTSTASNHKETDIPSDIVSFFLIWWSFYTLLCSTINVCSITCSKAVHERGRNVISISYSHSTYGNGCYWHFSMWLDVVLNVMLGRALVNEKYITNN
jgi:hypothetical protein